jgi:hypothetical protein
MLILGLALAAPFDSSDHVLDPFASVPPLLSETMSKEATKFAFRSDGSCIQSSIASKPKPSVSKLESYKFLDYFD